MKTQSQTTVSGAYNVRKLTMLGILSAIAYVVMVIGRIPIVEFLKYDPKDIVITIGGFLFGPLSAFLVTFIVAVFETLTVSNTGPYGLLMNILSTCAFSCTAALIYKKNRFLKGAVAGLLAGCVLMVVVMLAWNYIITPYYLGVPREEVTKMLLPVFLPFNLLKSGLNATLTLLLYKPLSNALHKANLIPERQLPAAPVNKRFNIGTLLVAFVVFATCVLFILIINHIL